MKMTKAQLQRAVMRKQEEMSEEEIFSSSALEQMMQDVVSAVCHKFDRRVKVICLCQPDSMLTACTNGERITLNTLGPLIRDLPTAWEKYVSNFGHVTHECGHLLHTDFQTINPLRKGWMDPEFSFGKWRPEEEEKAGKIEQYCRAHPNFSRIYGAALSHLENIMEDIYIENRLYEEFDGLCAAGLHLVNDENFRLSGTEKELYQSVSEGKILPVHAALNVLQLRKLGYSPKQGEALTAEEERIRQEVETVLSESEPYLSELEWESNGEKRALLLNEAALHMFDLVPQKEETETEKEEGDPQPADYDLGEALLVGIEAERQLNANGMTQEAHGYTAGVESETDKERSEENRQDAGARVSSVQVMDEFANTGQKMIAEKEVLREDETAHMQELRNGAARIYRESRPQSMGGTGFSRYCVKRSAPDTQDIDAYLKIYDDVRPAARALTRKLDHILKERKEEGFDSGYLKGQRFNAGDVYRKDGKYFSREILPEGAPNVVFGLIVDQSGSMDGMKIQRARASAILLESVLSELGVDFLIVGHDSYCEETNLYIYADFDTNDGLDRYRLAKIEAGGRNCDGAVITYMGKRLLERPEENKVMIVISDGCPTESSFYDIGNDQNDTILAVQKYRKAGIRIFGAVLDDYEDVREIYDERYCFDCTEYGELQKSLMRIIKKYVLR